MGTDRIRRWESELLTQTSPGIVPWYVEPVPALLDGAAPAEPGLPLAPGDGSVDHGPAPSGRPIPTPRRSGAGPRSADDVHGQIKGFASTGAVAPGEAIDFRITVNPPQQYGVDIYRIGHCNGDGAVKVTSSPRLSGIVQPAPLTAERTVSCHHWWLSWRLQVPADWAAGAYVAVLTTADGYRSHIPFTVRTVAPPEARGPGGRPPLADLLLVLPDVTWQAYNVYPEDGRTGASLHHAWDENGRLLGEDDAAVTVSFDRPYAGTGLPLHIGQAYDFIRWAERYGYTPAYADARDLHAGRIDPSRYRGVVFPGRGEYWSEPMRRAAEWARDSGTSLVFLSAGTLYRRAELMASPSGDPDRLLSCRKRRGVGIGRPVTWRDAGESEQLLLGVQYAGRVPEPRPLVVRNAGQWLWEGTGCGDGDELPGLVAGEADRYYPRTPLPEHVRRILLSHSPFEDDAGAVRHQETSLYRAPSGALVFAAGTSAWCAALGRPGHADERIQRATANLLDRICKHD
ncbi:N,N-dimethylformamidase beta subunit family domain-containing protein [Streptomyces meridianus]|uniref:N,N-dimethylformamidase beta subunit family domain-containing protein n=1 Tax=Streptomyces meridianus TaxID=2938945 RepID=UPI003558FA7A